LLSVLSIARPSLADEPASKPPARPSPSPADDKPAARDDAQRKPQVRTYSSVTVVSDPAQAPRLPVRAQAPVIERPQREDRHEAGNENRREQSRADSMRELRQEIKEMRRDLRDAERERREQPRAGAPAPQRSETPRQNTGEPSRDRYPAHDRQGDRQGDRHVDRPQR
jgi:hypothetical protein